MADVEESAARFIRAFNAHDEDAMRKLTHPNATLAAPGTFSSGLEANGYATQWIQACPDAN